MLTDTECNTEKENLIETIPKLKPNFNFCSQKQKKKRNVLTYSQLKKKKTEIKIDLKQKCPSHAFKQIQ